jgi:hypothetical protein
MTRGELLDFLTEQAKEFRNDKTSISRNSHLTSIKEQPEQYLIDGVLVAFINHIGISQCIDYALSVDDL